MLLAGDVGGTKTLIGLFRARRSAPDGVDVRSYRTLDFPDLGALCSAVSARDVDGPADIEAASFGVAGPVTGTRARLTNVPWVVDLDALRNACPFRAPIC